MYRWLCCTTQGMHYQRHTSIPVDRTIFLIHHNQLFNSSSSKLAAQAEGCTRNQPAVQWSSRQHPHTTALQHSHAANCSLRLAETTLPCYKCFHTFDLNFNQRLVQMQTPDALTHVQPSTYPSHFTLWHECEPSQFGRQVCFQIRLMCSHRCSHARQLDVCHGLRLDGCST